MELDNYSGFGAAPAFESIELEDNIPVSTNLNDVNREATRYLFFAGDVLVPSQKRERRDLKTGGEYFGQQYKTLVRSKGLLRRCQITPLEIGFDFMSDDMIGDDANLHVVTTVNHEEQGRGALQASPVGKLNGIKVYPGDEIKGILQGERNNTSKGIVELNQLAGVDYPEFKKSGLQEFVFPEELEIPSWAKIMAGLGQFPTKLSQLEAHFNSRKDATSDGSIKSLVDGMLASCEQYRVWGVNYLKLSSQLVRLPANQGFVHTYSELAEMLFESLEVRREDLISSDRDLAEIVAKASAGNGISGAETQLLLERMAANQELLTKVFLGQQPPVEAISEIEVEKVRCGKLKANGEPCSRTLEAGETACFQHR